MGTMLLMLGLLGAWTSDGVRDGFHVAQTGQRTWYPHTYGGIVSYGNYHDFVMYENISVAMAGTGAYLWSKDDPEWWRVAGVTVGTSLVGWLAREWIIDYVPTGHALRKSASWQSGYFGQVRDNGLAFQLGVGAAGAGLATAAILIPHHQGRHYNLRAVPTPQGLELALNF
jgi:hypothetical protein